MTEPKPLFVPTPAEAEIRKALEKKRLEELSTKTHTWGMA